MVFVKLPCPLSEAKQQFSQVHPVSSVLLLERRLQSAIGRNMYITAKIKQEALNTG